MTDLRDGFRAIAGGWMLRDDAADLQDRLERLVEWCDRNLPVTPDELATIKCMVESLIVREIRERFGIELFSQEENDG